MPPRRSTRTSSLPLPPRPLQPRSLPLRNDEIPPNVKEWQILVDIEMLSNEVEPTATPSGSKITRKHLLPYRVIWDTNDINFISQPWITDDLFSDEVQRKAAIEALDGADIRPLLDFMRGKPQDAISVMKDHKAGKFSLFVKRLLQIGKPEAILPTDDDTHVSILHPEKMSMTPRRESYPVPQEHKSSDRDNVHYDPSTPTPKGLSFDFEVDLSIEESIAPTIESSETELFKLRPRQHRRRATKSRTQLDIQSRAQLITQPATRRADQDHGTNNFDIFSMGIDESNVEACIKDLLVIISDLAGDNYVVSSKRTPFKVVDAHEVKIFEACVDGAIHRASKSARSYWGTTLHGLEDKTSGLSIDGRQRILAKPDDEELSDSNVIYSSTRM